MAVIGHLEPGRLLVLSDPRQSPAQASSCAIVDIETSEIARSPVCKIRLHCRLRTGATGHKRLRCASDRSGPYLVGDGEPNPTLATSNCHVWAGPDSGYPADFPTERTSRYCAQQGPRKETVYASGILVGALSSGRPYACRQFSHSRNVSSSSEGGLELGQRNHVHMRAGQYRKAGRVGPPALTRS